MGSKGEKTKQMIKEEAKALFAAKGYKEVTMTEICLAAGLSRGGLYRHYGSTEQIFSEIVEEMLNIQEDEFSVKIEKGDSAEKILGEVLERYRSEMSDSTTSLSLAIYEYYSSIPLVQNNALKKQYDRSKEMWKRLIGYGIEKKEFNHVDSEAVFDLIVFSYQGVRMYSKIMQVEDQIPIGIVRQIKKILLK